VSDTSLGTPWRPSNAVILVDFAAALNLGSLHFGPCAHWLGLIVGRIKFAHRPITGLFSSLARQGRAYLVSGHFCLNWSRFFAQAPA